MVDLRRSINMADREDKVLAYFCENCGKVVNFEDVSFYGQEFYSFTGKMSRPKTIHGANAAGEPDVAPGVSGFEIFEFSHYQNCEDDLPPRDCVKRVFADNRAELIANLVSLKIKNQ